MILGELKVADSAATTRRHQANHLKPELKRRPLRGASSGSRSRSSKFCRPSCAVTGGSSDFSQALDNWLMLHGECSKGYHLCKHPSFGSRGGDCRFLNKIHESTWFLQTFK